jgi:O-acetylserine/cysteine efflux transporter
VPLPLAALSLLVDGPGEVIVTLTNLQAPTILSALYTAVFASLVGYGIWNRLLASHPSSAVVPFTLLVPVVGMTAAWLALGEVPTPTELAGGLLLLGGVATAVLTLGGQRRQRRVAGPVPGLGAGLRTGGTDDGGRLADAGTLAGAREPEAR